MFADPARTGVTALPRLRAALDVVPDLLAEIRAPLWRTVRQGRLGGPRRRYLVALMDLCVRRRLPPGRHRALLAAVRGSPADAREIAQQIIGRAEPRGVGTARVHAHHALVLADLAAGEHTSAYQHATEIRPPGVLPSHVPHALWIVMDLVEAAVRTGRGADAERHVRAVRDAGIAGLSPRLAIDEGRTSRRPGRRRWRRLTTDRRGCHTLCVL